ncbi:MAG: glycosyltransferase [Bacteroidetes bacterium]|nr:glycosyltransferase [Bacteroidota bacterium]
MKRVSVILATYNGEDTIEATIRSMLNQDGMNEQFELELIVVDDCSTDRTTDIIKQFNLQVFSTLQNSGGPNKGRNIGLKHATGDYICIADQDDIWARHKVISMLPYFDQAPIVTSGYKVVDLSEGKEVVRINQNDEGFTYFGKNKTFISRLLRLSSGQNTYLGSIMFEASLKNILFEEIFGAVDYDWVLKLFHQRDSIEVSDVLYLRKVNGKNLSLNESYRKKDFYFSLMFIEEYRDLYPEEVKTASLKIFGTRARYYYLMDNMKLARFYFLRSQLNAKTLLYYLTSFAGSNLIKRNFNVFG